MSEENGFFMQYDVKWKIISEKQLYFALKFYCIASDILSNTFMVLKIEDSNPQTPCKSFHSDKLLIFEEKKKSQ